MGMRKRDRGAEMVQSVKRLTLDFDPGRDLTVCGIELCVGLYTDSVEPAWDFLSLSLSLYPSPTWVSGSLSQNKLTFFKKGKESNRFRD